MANKINPIDSVLRSRLEKLEAPYDPKSWELMDQRLDEEVMGEVEAGSPVTEIRQADQAVFDKLHRYEVPFRPNHWKRMEALLEEAFVWPGQVLRYKLAELSLMALLLLLLWQYMPVSGFSEKAVQAYDATTTIPASERADIPDLSDAASPTEALPRETNNDQHAQPASEPPSGGGVTPGSLPSAPVKDRGLLAPLPSHEGDSAIRRLPGQKPFLFNRRPTLLLPGTLSSAAAEQASAEAADKLATLSPDYLDYSFATGDALVIALNQKLHPILRVGMFASGEYNHIMVPPSLEKRAGRDGFERYSVGYGGGLSLGVEMGRWELELGAIYAARQYPVGLVYVEGSLRTGLQGSELNATQLNIINVPLHLRYNVVDRGPWRAYVLAGSSVQVVFQSNYYTSDAPAFSFLPGDMASPIMSGEESAIQRIRRDGVGWFEGGTFEENAYLTGNMGLGLERYISSRWSVFVQPTYQHSIQYFRGGLGPNNDQINSMSLFFGTKVRLK